MKLPLAYYGNPILRKKCARVEAITDELRQLVRDMEETMMSYDGVGLAAPQVHKNLALFMINMSIKDEATKEYEADKTLTQNIVFINPKILHYSEEGWLRGEGCLSIPKIYGVVGRPLHIKVEAMDIEGNIFTKEFSGLAARAIMHENDHINGVLFIDRIRGKEREEMEPALRALKKKYSSKQ